MNPKKNNERKFRYSRSSERGMTLLEILVAVALLAFIGVVTSGTLVRTFQAKETIQKVNDDYHGARAVLDRMARELSMSFLTPKIVSGDESKTPKTIFRAKDSTISEVFFTSFSHIRTVQNTVESDQSVIGYYGKSNPDKNGVYKLYRREKTILDAYPEKGGLSFELMDNVVKLELLYWDKVKADFVKEWDTEKIEFQGKLPPLIEIRLTFRNADGEEIMIMTRTKLFWYRFITRS